MPPEPLSWERKDFFKVKKYEERSESKTLGSVARWRDESSFNHGLWGGSDEVRRPIGDSRQSGYPVALEEPDNGFEPLRSSERMAEGESSSGLSSERKFEKNKQAFSQSWDIGDAGANLSGKHHELTPKRSVSDLLTYTSQNPDLKGHHDNKMDGVDGMGTGQRYCNGKDQSQSLSSIAWKRTTSLSSRGSGFSHSSSSRSMQVQSPSSGDAAVDGIIPSPLPFEDPSPRKKPRLGWGQGLAKYEKRKVEGSDETVSKSALVPCSNNTRLPSPSPRLTTLSECASPATTSSVACSSSPGLDEKPHMESANNDNGTSNLIISPAQGSRSNHDDLSVDQDQLELASITNLSSRLVDLLQAEDASSGDSNPVKINGMNKLLLLKSEFLKALEMTESEIDLSENELNQLVAETKVFQEADVNSKVFQKPPPLQLEASEELLEKVPSNDVLKEIGEDTKDDDIDSLGSATSKLVEPSSVEKKVFASDSSATLLALKPTFFSAEKKSSSISGDANGLHENSVTVTVCCSGEEEECTLNGRILTSNKVSARKASEVFNNLLPTDTSPTDPWGVISTLSQETNNFVKEKLKVYKGCVRFKEQALTLKFRALQYLWKEDLHFQSLKKYKAKSQKRIESSLRPSNCGYQKHRSAIRSRFTSPGGNLTLVPTPEAEEFTCKLLSDKQFRPCRDTLRMPTLMLGEKEKRLSRFANSNGLMEDPCAIEKERSMMNPWTPKEKDIFIEMLATFGKNFVKIASFLDHKTTADCVEFYYKNQKSESFEKIKKKPEQKQGRSFPSDIYLLPQGMTSAAKNWNREVNAASLDILGAASAMAARADARSALGGQLYNKKLLWGNENEVVAADALAGISGAISCEAMGSCVTSSLDPRDGCKKKFVTDQPLTPEVLQSIDDADEETCSDDSCGETDSVDWTDEEKSNFLVAVGSYGKDFGKIAQFVRTRSSDQCKIFFSKARKSLGLDMIHPGSGNDGTPVRDINGGRSDTEDACHLETESAICSTQSYSKMDLDPDPLSVSNRNPQALNPEEDETGMESIGKVDGGDPGELEVLPCDDAVMMGASLSSTHGVVVENSNLNAEADCIKEEKKEDQKFNPIEESRVELDVTPDDLAKGFKTELEQLQLVTSDSDYSSKLSPRCSEPDSNVKGVDPNPNLGSETSASRGNTNYQNSQPVSWEQKENYRLSVSNDSILWDSSENLQQVAVSSTLNFEEAKKKQQQKKPANTCIQQRLSGSKHLLNGAEKSQILRGFPLQVLHKRETNGSFRSNPYIVRDFYSEMNNGLGSPNTRAELPLHTKNHDQLSNSCSQSSSDTEEHTRRVGDVKLFGQILSHPSSSSQNQDPSSLQKQVLNTRESTSNLLNIPSKVSVSNYSTNLDNYPIRTHGFWDGNRIQTVPESALLMSKYPASFAADQQSLPAIIKRNDRNLGSVSVFPSPDLGLRDYRHVYRSYDAQQIQPLMTVDVFSELQKRKELASFQQQPRSVGGGILVGSGCTTGISDPVAAIKMHYAKQGGNTREDHSWRGDVGR
ncbi:hypothetical protein GIB67_030260 [Kingdonia uniflora]|uniref:SANT domain-containing protein n=1 Tax=Kingdonia uniflora TaxID=39325 RepID=A0A7J7M6E8_9MAGN|nr:hypothetical protein GIB67_030260 [Kingdonia uniflora]